VVASENFKTDGTHALNEQDRAILCYMKCEGRMHMSCRKHIDIPSDTVASHITSTHLIHHDQSPPLSGHDSLGGIGSGTSPFGARDGTKETWNLSLYHGGSVLSEGELLEGKKACFDCLLKQILAVRGTPGNIGGAVIAPGDEVTLADVLSILSDCSYLCVCVCDTVYGLSCSHLIRCSVDTRPFDPIWLVDSRRYLILP
jgi:hypothetical protein